MYSKHSRSQEINLWFYKMTPHGGNSEVPVIKSLYPNSHVILNTRHPHPSIKSSRKVHNALRESVSGKLGYWWRHFTMTPNYRVILEIIIYHLKTFLIRFQFQDPVRKP